MLSRALWWIGLPLRLLIAAIMLGLGALLVPHRLSEIRGDARELVWGPG